MRAIGDSNLYKPIEKCSFINNLYSVPKKILKWIENNDP